MATTINLNAAASVSIPAGSMLYVTGQGIVTYDNTFVIRGPQAIQGNSTFGPYNRAVTISLSATNTALSYYSTPGPINSRGDLVLTGAPDLSSIRDSTLSALGNSGIGTLGMRNWKKSNTAQIRAAMAGAAGRDFRSRFIFIGDSSVSGTQSARAGTVNARRKSWVSQLEDMGLAAGYQVNENWWMGDGGTATLPDIAAYDPRVAFGATTDYTNQFAGPGRGVPRMLTSAAQGKITFTPRQPFDTIDVLFLTGNAGVGTATVQNQAAAGAGSFNTQIGNGNAHYTATVPAGSTAAVVALAGTTQVYVNGFGTRDSTKPGIEIINIGISGIDLPYFNLDPAQGNNWNGWRAAASKLMTAATRNVVFITAGHNGFTTIDQLKATLRVQIEFLKGLAVVPDIVPVNYANLATPNMGLGTFDLIQQAIIDVGLEYDLACIDQRPTMESGAVLQAADEQAGDGLHNFASGQSITARTVWGACVASRSLLA